MPGAELLHEWLRRSAERHPDQPAVVEGDRTVCLGELYQRARSLAVAFRELGLEPGGRVGLVMEKTTEAVTAIFGTLMAGGVYVPVQPDWPRGRIETVLDECGARLLVADAEAGAPPQLLDRRSGASHPWADAISVPPPSGAAGAEGDPEDPALILFTSGSTGVPKGVTISHRAVGAFVDWSASQFGLGPEDRIACPSPLSFDLSTLDVLSVARCAATCLIAPRAAAWVPRLLLSLCREKRATVWYSVPSLLVRMMDKAGLERDPLSGLRVILFAGEVMPAREAARLRASHPQAELYNLYGPTETNVVSFHRLPPVVDPARPVPIGKPCPYARLRLESEDHPATSLLLAGGETLMAGYWGRPEETGRAFVDVDEGGGRHRFYRTGDRVAVGPDGELSFVGRADRQVKRRGYRIELGEIEAALGSHPELSEVAVVGPSEGAGLVSAFLTRRGEVAPSELDLRAHCARRLPPYMIPDRFLVLEEMPRGNRGKIDYAALSKL